jgi:hypothetical protein
VEDLERLVRRIASDFAEPRLGFPGLAFRSAAEWGEDGADDLIAVSGGHEFRVAADLDDEQAAVEIADQLQDDAMDRLGAPWPTLLLPDGREAVLQPRLGPDGVAAWTAKTGHRCPVGQLRATFGHMIK